MREKTKQGYKLLRGQMPSILRRIADNTIQADHTVKDCEETKD